MDEVETSFYTAADEQSIADALQEAKPWDAKCIQGLKQRIYKLHRARQQSLCCYCQRDQHGEFKLVIDIEHILPKRKYRPQMFELWNLSVSCKRCNMQIKGQRTDFLVDKRFQTIHEDDPNGYRFIHPNLDPLHQDLVRHAIQCGSKRLVKYVIAAHSKKGRYTYKYFRLDELEIDSFDAAQNPEVQHVDSPTLDVFRTIVKQLRASGE